MLELASINEQYLAEISRLRRENNELKLALRSQRQEFADTTSPEHSILIDIKHLSNYSTKQQISKITTNYHFSDLVDISLLKKVLDAFYEATGIGYTLHDADNNVLSSIGWQDICVKFHHHCAETRARCKQSDSYIAEHLHNGTYIGYKCLNGLMDYAIPILVEGQHMATIFTGQLLHEPPDEEFFRYQAQVFGFDESAYMDALYQVPIIPKEKIGAIINFFGNLAQIIAKIGLDKLRQLEKADLAKKRNRERLALVLESSNDGFWDWNISSGKIYLSLRLAEMLGYSPDEIDSNCEQWAKIIHPEDLDALIKEIKDHLNGQTPIYKSEFRVITKTGSIKWILGRGKIVAKNQAEQPERMVGTCIDITERKRIEEALRLSEKLLSKAFNASPVIMAITTLDEGRFIKVNSAFCRTLGYDEKEIISKTTFSIAFWDDYVDRIIIKQKLEQNEPVKDMQTYFRKKNGEKVLGLYSAEKIEINNEPCILSVFTDITEQKKMEVEMARLDRLNVVGEMAASIGHEIRNPMTTVRGFLQLLQQNNNYQLDREHFDLMIEEIDRANSIITEFLSLAKNKTVELELTNLNSIINKLMPLLQAEAMSRDQYIKAELTELPDLYLDKKEIRQLILNLVKNGLEAMPSAGFVTIATFICNSSVVLAIKDQGSGIDINLLEKIGTPFLTTKEQGTGLGLAVCYRIANRHNAAIDFKTSSKGTTFYVNFPL